MSGASPARTDRSATESMPPERPSTTWVPGEIDGAIAAATLSGNSFELGFLEFPITHQALEALLDEFLGTLVGETAQSVGQSALEVLRHRSGVAMRAAERLADDPVDQTEGLQPAGGDAQRLCRLGRPVRALPQDRGSAFRRNHRVSRVLQHHHGIADRDREGSARSAFPDHRAYDRHPQLGHHIQAVADRLSLAALLRTDPGVRPRSIDESQDRNVELFREPHEAHRLAVAFGPRHAEVAEDL